MNNGKLSAHPTFDLIEVGKKLATESQMKDASKMFGGLTKREHFAGLAMQAMISSKYYGEFASEFTDSKDRLEGVALAAVRMADALLKELDK